MRRGRDRESGAAPAGGPASERHAGMTPVGPVWSIVLAAGSGARFGDRKQFATAGGSRLVDLAVDVARNVCDHVVVVLPRGEPWTGPWVDKIARGGRDRGASVRSGLAAISASAGTVVVHQAANPLASPELFEALLSAIACGAPAAFPGLRPVDLVRVATGPLAGPAIGRDELVLVQAPAAFRLDVLRNAHSRETHAVEDTSIVSAAGYDVHVVPGDPRNIHVATPEDLEIVAALLRSRPQ